VQHHGLRIEFLGGAGRFFALAALPWVAESICRTAWLI
jgi:hypothetical protein